MWVIFVLAVFLMSLPTAPRAQLFELDRDRLGADYKSFVLAADDPSVCDEHCAADPECYAWTMLKAGMRGAGSPAMCFLKKPAPLPTANTCCISGIKREVFRRPVTRPYGVNDNSDYFGADYKSFPLSQTEPSLCGDACFADTRCRSWTYVRPNVQGANPICYLKHSVPALVSSGCCVAGSFSGLPARDEKIYGYETVEGPFFEVGGLGGLVEAPVACPAGKKAISAGWEMKPKNPVMTDAYFGMELKGAIPDGAAAKIKVRNANLGDAILARTYSVCVDQLVATREVSSSADSFPSVIPQCDPAEQVIGGGVWASPDQQVNASVPVKRTFEGLGDGVGNGWAVKTADNVNASPATVTSVCITTAAGANHATIRTSVPVSLSPRSTGTYEIACPGGMRVMSAGFSTDSDGLGWATAPLISTLKPTEDPSRWQAVFHNRNVALATVRGRLGAVCMPVATE